MKAELTSTDVQVLSVTPEVDDGLRTQAIQARSEGRERCGFLFGEQMAGTTSAYWISAPGAEATMTPGHCEPDYVWAAREKRRLAERYEKVEVVAGWHVHLGYGNHLSGGDISTLHRVTPRFPGFTALLIDCPRSGELSLGAYRLGEDGSLHQCRYQVDAVTPETRLVAAGRILEELGSARFDRTRAILPHPLLAKKRVLTVGLGSGGSTAVKYLGRAGLFHWTLTDNETLELANLVRHEGFPADIGRKKVQVMADMLKGLSPAMQVEPLEFDVRGDTSRLTDLAREHDLILACAGHPLANALINQAALQTGTPAVFAGVYPRAVGGYVLQVIPGKGPCLNCLYDLSKSASGLDSNEVVSDLGERYGIKEDDLHAQQGIYIDIAFVSLLQAKMALLTLLRGSDHDIGDWKGNLVLWNSHDLAVRAVQLKQREDCAVCNPEGWVRQKQLQQGVEGHPSALLGRIQAWRKRLSSAVTFRRARK